eukprot:4924290-Prymnesium_polylepis.2
MQRRRQGLCADGRVGVTTRKPHARTSGRKMVVSARRKNQPAYRAERRAVKRVSGGGPWAESS